MKVALTGARGMLASSIAAEWESTRPDDEVQRLTRADADLTDAVATHAMLERAAPDLLIHAAAKVGGIAANIADPAGYLMDNLLIDSSVLRAASRLGIERVVYVGSSCMYPKDYRQPLVEGDMLAAPLEPTNEGYAIAKIAAAKYCEYASGQFGLTYRTIVPSNLYGPGDDYAAGTSHLVAAAIAKTHAAATSGTGSVEVWGDGTARREFTYVGDVAAWLVSSIDTMAEWPALLNVGAGVDETVLEIYRTAARVTGFTGTFDLQPDRPAGMHQKLLDSTHASEWGWAPSTSLEDGMRSAFSAYLSRTA